MNINDLEKANNLLEEFKSAILGNTIITIRDSNTRELLWSCHTGEYYGRFKDENLEVEQEINLYEVIKQLKAIK